MSFNGAALFQARKLHCGNDLRRALCAASMGPRFFKRGNRPISTLSIP